MDKKTAAIKLFQIKIDADKKNLKWTDDEHNKSRTNLEKLEKAYTVQLDHIEKENDFNDKPNKNIKQTKDAAEQVKQEESKRQKTEADAKVHEEISRKAEVEEKKQEAIRVKEEASDNSRTPLHWPNPTEMSKWLMLALKKRHNLPDIEDKDAINGYALSILNDPSKEGIHPCARHLLCCIESSHPTLSTPDQMEVWRNLLESSTPSWLELRTSCSKPKKNRQQAQ